MRQVADVTVWTCWSVVVLVWVAGAVVGRRRQGPIRASASRDLASFAAFAAAAVVIATPRAVWHALVIGSGWLRLVGAVALVLASIAAVWARISLGTMWSSRAVVREEHVLRTGGPYRFTRHPIYTALLAMVAATALGEGIGRWLGILAAVTVVLMLKARAEERLLLTEFPLEYREYRQRVPRIVPSLRRGRPLRGPDYR